MPFLIYVFFATAALCLATPPSAFGFDRNIGSVQTDWIPLGGGTQNILDTIIAKKNLPPSAMIREVYPKRFALAIGVTKYDSPLDPLPSAEGDAENVGNLLRDGLTSDPDLHFNVDIVRNPDRAAFLKAVDKLSGDAKAEPGSFVVFYFSGHGFQKGGNLLMPAGVKDTNITSNVPIRYVLDKIAEAQASAALIIIDACRKNALLADNSERGLMQDSTDYPNTSFTILYAAQPGLIAMADNNPAERSAFTKALIAALKKDEYENLAGLYDDIRLLMPTGQMPSILNASNAAELRYTQDRLKRQRLLWLNIMQQLLRTRQSDDLKGFINHYPLSPFIDIARQIKLELDLVQPTGGRTVPSTRSLVSIESGPLSVDPVQSGPRSFSATAERKVVVYARPSFSSDIVKEVAGGQSIHFNALSDAQQEASDPSREWSAIIGDDVTGYIPDVKVKELEPADIKTIEIRFKLLSPEDRLLGSTAVEKLNGTAQGQSLYHFAVRNELQRLLGSNEIQLIRIHLTNFYPAASNENSAREMAFSHQVALKQALADAGLYGYPYWVTASTSTILRPPDTYLFGSSPGRSDQQTPDTVTISMIK